MERLDKIKAKIKQRRAQMLIHSCLYYDMNTNIVSDDTWQTWAEELSKLIGEFPELNKIDRFDSYFEDWDGSTGHHLPFDDPWVQDKAYQILEIHEELTQNS